MNQKYFNFLESDKSNHQSHNSNELSQNDNEPSIRCNTLSLSDLYWLKFVLVKTIKWPQKLALIKIYKHPKHIFAEDRNALAKFLFNKGETKAKNLFDYDVRQFEQIIKFLESNSNIKLICYQDENYPNDLANIAKPPLILYACGNLDLLQKTAIAIVGSRHASYYGKEIAFDMANQLSRHNIAIISGMAAGIDSCAHKGSISSSQEQFLGGTIAVLGTGINICYPKSNATLFANIKKRGLILTEYHPWAPPLPYRFPQRNRIISGLSKGVVIIEASLKSGSLITAKMAIEENRDIFALPGSIHSVHSKGCHYLIKQGAKLIESVDDILNEYRHLLLSNQSNKEVKDLIGKQNKSKESLTKAQGDVLNSIEFTPTSLEKINSRSQIRTQQLSVILLQLELIGYIKQDETQKYRRTI